ncbi:ABC transporter permease [Phocaeicola barnesiae]
MWKQIFNQIWNQRRTNAWLWTELCIVTVLLWYGVDVVYNYEGAAWQPKGYDTSCVFDLTMGTKPMDFINDADNRRAGEDFTYLYNLIKDYPGVEEVCAYYGSVPYTDEVMSEGYAPHTDSTHVVNCYIRYVTSSYFKVFRLNPLAGQLDEEHWSSAENPVPTLMSVDLVDSLFQLPHAADAVGRTCFNPYWLNTKHPVTNYRVSAVLPRHKLGDYERYEPFIYLPADKALFWQHVALRVSPDQVAGFAERFRRDMQQVFDRGIFYLDNIRLYGDMKEAYDIQKGTVNYLNTVYTVAAFFLFNVFLCVFATFWYRTRKRRCEVALRMALGSSRRQVMRYFLLEGLVLLLMAVIPTLLIALNIQWADLTVHTLVDVSAARFGGCFGAVLLLLALMIVLGIWYPARRALQVPPAEALHAE